MPELLSQLSDSAQVIQHSLLRVLEGMALLWAFNIVNWLIGKPFLIFGIIPRNPLGLPGIFAAPILHADFNHLFFNSFPLLVLATGLLTYGNNFFIQTTIVITLISGLLTWLFARRAIHVGASALIMGYWSFLLVLAVMEKSMMSIALGFVCLYYFGGLLFSIFPQEVKVSWEGHLAGFIAGIITAWMWYQYYLPLPFLTFNI